MITAYEFITLVAYGSLIYAAVRWMEIASDYARWVKLSIKRKQRSK